MPDEPVDERQTSNPVSFDELSTHAGVIVVAAVRTATSLVGVLRSVVEQALFAIVGRRCAGCPHLVADWCPRREAGVLPGRGIGRGWSCATSSCRSIRSSSATPRIPFRPIDLSAQVSVIAAYEEALVVSVVGAAVSAALSGVFSGVGGVRSGDDGGSPQPSARTAAERNSAVGRIDDLFMNWA